jgi:hypothetical protein
MAMSALLPKADILRGERHVRQVPEADISNALNASMGYHSLGAICAQSSACEEF